MNTFTPLTILSTNSRTNRSRLTYYLSLLLACIAIAAAPAVRAEATNEDIWQAWDAPIFTQVFNDDFTADPNTNGQWTVHRYANDPTSEAVWDMPGRAWHLTRAVSTRGVAVFANYNLTATTWKAQFDYRAAKLGGLQSGGDGFVFMFYKNKAAYGVPAFGAPMGFELANFILVAGYGVKFDNYIEGCDPAAKDYVALIENDICHVLDFQQGDWVGANSFHTAQVLYQEGRMTLAIDGHITLNYELTDPDYTFNGVGFGAGTGSALGDYAIRNFRLWVAE